MQHAISFANGGFRLGKMKDAEVHHRRSELRIGKTKGLRVTDLKINRGIKLARHRHHGFGEINA